MTPEKEYDLYAKPENQLPQGARGAGGPADVAHTGAVLTRVAQRDLSPGGRPRMIVRCRCRSARPSRSCTASQSDNRPVGLMPPTNDALLTTSAQATAAAALSCGGVDHLPPGALFVRSWITTLQREPQIHRCRNGESVRWNIREGHRLRAQAPDDAHVLCGEMIATPGPRCAARRRRSGRSTMQTSWRTSTEPAA